MTDLAKSRTKLDYRFLWMVFCAFVLAKLFIAFKLPLMTDEAYYIHWGDFPSWYYYDHPPAIGWVAWLVRTVMPRSASPDLVLFAFRLLPIAAVSLVAWMAALLACPEPDPGKRAVIALLYFLLPEVLVGGLIYSTDFLALVGVTLSGVLIQQHLRSGRLGFALLAGLALACGFLGKETAAFALLGLALWWLFNLRSRSAWKTFLAVQLGFWPLALFWLYQTIQNCSGPLTLHLGRAVIQPGVKWLGPPSLLIIEILLLGPWTVYATARWLARHKEIRNSVLSPRAGFIPPWLIAGNLVFLVASSAFSAFGLHWSVLYHPFAIALAGRVLPVDVLARMVRYQALLALVVAALAIGIVTAPLGMFKRIDGYKYIVFLKEAPDLCASLKSAKEKRPSLNFASVNYGFAAVLQFYCGIPFSIISSDAKYGRSDDLWTDWMSLQRGDIFIFSVDAIDRDRLGRYFESAEFIDIKSSDHEITFRAMIGHAFSAERYRAGELERIRQTFYAKPFLHDPQRCPFVKQYFGVP